MMNKLFKILLISVGLSIASPAFAIVTYTYTGNSLIADLNDERIIPAVDPIIIMMNFSDDGFTLIDWSVSQAQVGTINKSNTSEITASNLLPILNLKTDQTGQVTSWFVTVLSIWDLGDPNNGANYYQNILSFNGQDYYGYKLDPYFLQNWDLALALAPLPTREMIAYGSNQISSGTWTYTSALANLDFKSVTPVPEPDTYAMLIAGLGLIGISRRKAS
jgi:hypothetical protein